jgi:hypothetical protein
MLDRRLHEVDFGAHRIRAEFQRMLADFDTATRGQWVRSAPLPSRAACSGHRPVPDRPGDDVTD